jgi:hypothetical protein
MEDATDGEAGQIVEKGSQDFWKAARKLPLSAKLKIGVSVTSQPVDASHT